MSSDSFDCDHVPRCEDAAGHVLFTVLIEAMLAPIEERTLHLTEHLNCFKIPTRFYHPREN